MYLAFSRAKRSYCSAGSRAPRRRAARSSDLVGWAVGVPGSVLRCGADVTAERHKRDCSSCQSLWVGSSTVSTVVAVVSVTPVCWDCACTSEMRTVFRGSPRWIVFSQAVVLAALGFYERTGTGEIHMSATYPSTAVVLTCVLPSSTMTIQMERPATKKTWKSEEKQGGNILDLHSSGVGLVLLLVCGEKRRGVAAGRQSAGDRDVNLFVLSCDERYLGTDST